VGLCGRINISIVRYFVPEKSVLCTKIEGRQNTDTLVPVCLPVYFKKATKYTPKYTEKIIHPKGSIPFVYFVYFIYIYIINRGIGI